MFIDDFIWLPEIVDKIQIKHQVTTDEAEELFFNKPYFRFVESGHRPNENVYAAMGRTDAGRYLIAFFIHKSRHLALILSVRDMDNKERRNYDHR